MSDLNWRVQDRIAAAAERAAVAIERACTAEEDRCLAVARPSVLFRPRLSLDGDQWCALVGECLQDGVAGFGGSPDAAMRDFDRAWRMPLDPPGAKRGGK
mgnify:CR=1 FL=1